MRRSDREVKEFKDIVAIMEKSQATAFWVVLIQFSIHKPESPWWCALDS